ncbi:MAG: D-alanyl-D-alanine carboxypeptidase family protein, partial [Cyanobacteria bacterium P01_A01_bin.17]
MHDDIPEAFRQPVSESSSPSATPLVWVGSALGLAVLAAGGWFALSALNTNPSESISEVAPAAPSPTPSAEPTTDDLLGHLSYEEAPPQELKPISADGRLKLRTSAAQAYQRMLASAKAAGVSLQP